jgi:hypothetical protein
MDWDKDPMNILNRETLQREKLWSENEDNSKEFNSEIKINYSKKTPEWQKIFKSLPPATTKLDLLNKIFKTNEIYQKQNSEQESNDG